MLLLLDYLVQLRPIKKVVIRMKNNSKRIIQIIFILLLQVFATTVLSQDESSTQVTKFKFDDNYDESTKLEQYAKEVQNLLARIETLEHKLSTIEQKIKSDNNEPHKNLIMDQQKADSVANVDIFEAIEQTATERAHDTKTETATTAEIKTDKKLYDLALAALKDKKFEEAEKQFAIFVENYSQSPLISNAYFWYGESFFRRNIFDKATIYYLKGYKQAPRGQKAADTLLKLAIALGELGKKQEACGVIAKLESEFPNRPAASIKRCGDTKIKLSC